MILRTKRLIIRSATRQIAEAEEKDHAQFAKLLRARVPAEWPPKSLLVALPSYHHALTIWPDWGWHLWYAVERRARGNILCGSLSFVWVLHLKGFVEMGYSVLPEFQGSGLCTEMVSALTRWVLRQPHVRAVLAEVHRNNGASLQVMAKSGFQHIGNGMKRRTILFCK